MKIFRAVVTKQAGGMDSSVLFSELFIFVFILFFGLIYAWRKGVLIWE